MNSNGTTSFEGTTSTSITVERATAVREDHDDLARIGREPDERGLEIIDEQIIRDEYVCPYEGFLDEEEERDDS